MLNIFKNKKTIVKMTINIINYYRFVSKFVKIRLKSHYNMQYKIASILKLTLTIYIKKNKKKQ